MRASRTILALILTLAAGCAAHDGGAASRGGRYASTSDRSADGWTRVKKGKGSRTAALSSPAPADEKKKASPTKKDATPRKPAKDGANDADAKKKEAPKKSPKPKKPIETRLAMLDPAPIPAGLPEWRTRVIREGRKIIDGKAAKPPRQDCSGYVMAVYSRAGKPLEIPHKHTLGTKAVSEMLYRWAKADGRTHKSRPQPGDLAFFRNTFGKLDGRITHIAIVESVDAAGNVKLIHNIGGRYRRSPMNLSDPHEPLKNGFFRKKGSANEPVLAGELFVAYARP